ncbi:Cys-tRNA(Pro) deacylase [uncultured Odoribacter sp.]|mgnify:CR=1 FL=1|uniref:Cys-tRNA(Pro) deacylase n=1 Tax=uncultured Odoribacter sp. TaxID=876416 RepID=UPI0026308705|nr:Cys-tRNA(Pro) deacylase [uncultured Odoribacter sp.]
MKINKTNAARLLDKARIPYELIPYKVDENNLSATHVAAQLNENIQCVFKTLVLEGDKTGYFVCIIPGDQEVDLKLAAKASANKKADLIPQKELLPLTGYIRGGCSPIGMKKNFPTFIHPTCLKFPSIYISAGIRGLQIKISPQSLIYFSRAKVTELTHSQNEPTSE